MEILPRHRGRKPLCLLQPWTKKLSPEMEEETRGSMDEEVLSEKFAAMKAAGRYGVTLNMFCHWLRCDQRWIARQGYRHGELEK